MISGWAQGSCPTASSKQSLFPSSVNTSPSGLSVWAPLVLQPTHLLPRSPALDLLTKTWLREVKTAGLGSPAFEKL